MLSHKVSKQTHKFQLQQYIYSKYISISHHKVLVLLDQVRVYLSVLN